MARRQILLAAAALLLPLLVVAAPALTAAWRYERSALAAGEWWRLAGAHLVHLDLRHALLNALAAGALVLLFARDLRNWQWLATFVIAAATVDAGLWWLQPRIDWYVGASGALHGVIAAGALQWRRRRDARFWILAPLLVAKLAYEQWTRSDLGFASAAPVVVDAHLYGAIGGLLAGVLLAVLPRQRLPA